MFHSNFQLQRRDCSINKSTLDEKNVKINEDVLREIFNHVNFTTRFKLSLADKCCLEIRKKTAGQLADSTCIKLYTIARSSMLKKLEKFSENSKEEDSKEFVTLFDKFIKSDPFTFSHYFQKLLNRSHVRSIDLKILRIHLNKYIPSKEDLQRVLDDKIKTRNRSISDDEGEYLHGKEFYEMGLIFARLGNFEDAYKCAAIIAVHHFNSPHVSMIGGIIGEICLSHIHAGTNPASTILSELNFTNILTEISKCMCNYINPPPNIDEKYIKYDFLKYILSSLSRFEYELAEHIAEIVDGLTEYKEIMVEGYISLGKFDKAIEYYKTYSNQSKNLKLLIFYDQIAKQINICHKQQESAINMIKADLKTIAGPANLVVKIFLKLGDIDEAEKLLDQMKQSEDSKLNLPRIMVKLACGYRDSEKIEECISYLEDVTTLFKNYSELTKDSTDAFDQGLKSAECYISIGKVREAANILNKLNPNYLKENHFLKHHGLLKFAKLSILINPQTDLEKILKLFGLQSLEHTLLIFKLSQWAIKTKFKAFRSKL